MRVYIKNNDEEYTYPDQMLLILTYLRAHGELKISGHSVENFYSDFSDERYCAGWMSIKDIDDPLLEEFAEWLSNINL